MNSEQTATGGRPPVARRGTLKVYLGAAPGVGKTYAMLTEARELVSQGRDVVVALVETHGRRETARLVEGLECVPRRQVHYRGSTYDELDVDAVLARAPEIALVDELAHTVVGSEEKRWQDIERLRDAGIDVISTINIQHLESLNDVVRSITGTHQRERVPDKVLRAADEIELVDLSPYALRARLSKGLIYKAEKVDAALSKYFRAGNLTALRELALLWLADRVDEGLEQYRSQERIEDVWPARDRILVAVAGGPDAAALIRRGARIAGRMVGRELHVVHVVQENGLRDVGSADLQAARELTEQLDGTWHTVSGDDVAAALIEFAHALNSSQLVIGTSRSGWLERMLGGGVFSRIINSAGSIDVHIVTHQGRGRGRRPHRKPAPLALRRRIAGWVAAFVLPAILTAVLMLVGRTDTFLPIGFLSYITVVVAVAIIGGWWPALTTALVGTAALNWFFTIPIGTFTIAQWENIIALILFIAVAGMVAVVVGSAARRADDARNARAQALVLSELAGTVIREGTDVQALLVAVAETFGQSAVYLRRRDEDGQWVERAAAGPDGEAPSEIPDGVTTELPLDDDHILVLHGRVLSASQQRTLNAYAGRIVQILHEEELRKTKIHAQRLAAGNAVRTALLTAVSHDLRTPLAGIKTAISSLRMTDVELPPDIQRDLLQTVEDSADRLTALISNLLDMSRIQSGALVVNPGMVHAADVIGSAISSVDPSLLPASIQVAVPEGLPPVKADYGLLERVLANLIENAKKYAGDRVVVDAGMVDDQVAIRVIDHGPGISDEQKATIFQPFKRLGDRDNRTGLGLGLAVAQGLAAAFDATLTAEDTPGGGLTMVITLETATTADTPAASATTEGGL